MSKPDQIDEIVRSTLEVEGKWVTWKREQLRTAIANMGSGIRAYRLIHGNDVDRAKGVVFDLMTACAALIKDLDNEVRNVGLVDAILALSEGEDVECRPDWGKAWLKVYLDPETRELYAGDGWHKLHLSDDEIRQTSWRVRSGGRPK